MSIVSANADGIRLAINAFVTDVDIVILPLSEMVGAGPKTYRYIVVAGKVRRERLNTDGRVEAAMVVGCERMKTDGRVGLAESAETERLNTGGRVVSARGVTEKRAATGSRVGVPENVAT